MKRGLFFAFLGILLLGLANPCFAQPIYEQDVTDQAPGPKWVQGEILVQFNPGTPPGRIRQVNQANQMKLLSFSERGRFYRLKIAANKTVEEMVAVYNHNPNVSYAEPNFIAQATMVPNDPLFGYQWHLDNPVYGGINMEAAWDIQTGSPSVVVAVVDTGVAYEDYDVYALAPDLAETPFIPGWDFINNDAHANDDHSHGTHVTGTIAQSTNNSLGVAGVAFGTTIMPVKVLNDQGSGSYAAVANGIYFAADNGAKVINMSLGGSSPSSTLLNALRYAKNAGVLIFCAAGNAGNGNNAPSYPAAYDECVAVGATRYDQTRSYYSNYGNYVDLVAPGGDLTVDQNHDGYPDGVLQMTFSKNPKHFGYYLYQGTSMATPHATGVAALLIAHGITNPADVRTAMENTALDLGTKGWDPEYGWGLIDAYAALNYFNNESPPADVHDVAISSITVPATVGIGDPVNVGVGVSNLGTTSESFVVTLTDTTDQVVIGTQNVNSLGAGNNSVLNFGWNTTGATEGTHVLRAEASVVSGETNTTDNSMDQSVDAVVAVYDLAVLGVDSPALANQGDVITVTVSVENQGTFSENTLLTLTDETDGTVIGSQDIGIQAGDIQSFNFDWDTTGASLQTHTLSAELDALAGESDLADNVGTSTVEISSVPTPTVSVSDISMDYYNRGPRHGGSQAYVSISDDQGQAVGGAQVNADWFLNGALVRTDSAVTGSDGVAQLDSKPKSVSSGDVLGVTVTNVSISGYQYDAAANTETSDSVTVP